MRNTSSESQKLEAQLTKLNSQYELARSKTQITAEALSKVKQATGENSEETRVWTNKLLSAQKQEESLKNQIEGTNTKLKAATQAESEAAKASEKRQSALKGLSTEQKSLETSSENLRKEYDLQVASLGKNATASEKAKLAKQYFAKQEQATAEQVKNLDKQLSIAKQEYGENSQEVQELNGKLLDAKKAHQDFANSLAQSNDKLQNFGNSMKTFGGKLNSIGKGMTMGVTAPIVAGVAASVKAANDFDTAFTGVKKTVDEVKDSNGKVKISYADLEKSIRNMAKTIPASTTEISHVAEAAGQLGIKTENVMSFTKTMIEMGEATNMSSEDAATALAKLANITGMPQKNFDRLGSSIVNLGNNMATTESDIVEMSLRLAGTGHQVGLTEPQITGLAAAMSSVGINAEAGGGAMSRVMQKMNTAVASGGDALDKFASVSGMSSSKFKKQWETDASGAIVKFIAGLGKAKKSGKDVTSVLKDMGINSTQEIDTMLRLSGSSGTLSKALDISAEGWKKNTALTNEAQKRHETFASKMQILKNKVTDLGIEFGGPLMDALSSVLDAMKPVLKVVSDLATKFKNADKPTQDFVLALIAMAAAIGPVLTVVGTLLTVIGGIAGLFATVTAGTVAIGVAIAAGIAILVAYIVTHWNQIKEATENIWNGIVSFLSGIWQVIVDIASGIWQGLSEFFSNLWNGISTTVMSIWQPIADFLTNLWTGIVTNASTIWNTLVDVFTLIFMTIQSVIEGVWTFITSWLTFAWQTIVALTQPIWQPIADFFVNLWNGISQVVQTVWNAITSFLSSVWNGIKSVATSIFNALSAFFSSVWNAISSVTSSVWNAIKSVVTGIWNGIKSTATSVFNGVKSVITNVWNGIKSVTSSVWNGIKSVISNVWNGIKSVTSTVVNAVKSVVTNAWNGIKSVTTSVWNGIKSAMTTPVEAAKSKISGIVDAIKGFFSGMHLSIPKIHLPAMPHFSISGSFDLKKKTVPHLSVQWYAKGGIMTQPTMFGMNNGVAQVGGEAGREAILPLNEKNLAAIGNQIAAATTERVENSNTTYLNLNMTNNIASPADSDYMIDKLDRYLGNIGIKKNFGIRGV